MFHELLTIAIFEALTDNYLKHTFGYSSSKYVFLSFAGLLIWGLERLFKKYADEMIKKYEDKKLLSLSTSFIILCLIFLPLIISIILLKK